MVPLDKELQWVNVKLKPVYLEIIQAYSIPCATLAYLEPWYIQNPDIFQIRNISRSLVYSERQSIQNSGIFKVQDLFRYIR